MSKSAIVTYTVCYLLTTPPVVIWALLGTPWGFPKSLNEFMSYVMAGMLWMYSILVVVSLFKIWLNSSNTMTCKKWLKIPVKYMLLVFLTWAAMFFGFIGWKIVFS